MAEILIPIKEFPLCCGRCPCFHAETPMYCQADKTIKMTAPYGKRMEGCPAKEVPPHGDLIDRNELPIIGITDYKLEGHTVIELEDVLNAPTVIPASEGK